MLPLLLLLGVGFLLYEATTHKNPFAPASSPPALPPAPSSSSQQPAHDPSGGLATPVGVPGLTADQVVAVLGTLPPELRGDLATVLVDPNQNPNQLLVLAGTLLQEGFVDAAAIVQLRAQALGASATANVSVPPPRQLTLGAALVDAPPGTEVAALSAPDPAAPIIGTVLPGSPLVVLDTALVLGFVRVRGRDATTGREGEAFVWSGFVRNQAPSNTSPGIISASTFLPQAGAGVVPQAPQDMVVTAPSGLQVRAQPSVAAPSFGVVPHGGTVTVVGTTATGWAQIKSQNSGHLAFVCNTCAEAPGGPWLAAPSSQPASAAVATTTTHAQIPLAQNV